MAGMSSYLPANAMVVISQLVKQFGMLRVIDNLTMSIGTGETFGLIGPNGSGKTTLIRMLVGLTRPTSGRITVMRERPGAKVAASIGYMTQSSALYQDLTARENLEFLCHLCVVRSSNLICTIFV